MDTDEGRSPGDRTRRQRGRRRRALTRPAALGRWAALLLAVWALVAGITLLLARGHVNRAEALLQQARSDVEDGSVRSASEALREATDLLGRARSTLSRPDVRLLGVLPVVGGDVRTSRTVVIAADDVARSAIPVLDGALGLADGDLSADGLPVDRLAELAPDVRATADAATRAVFAIQQTPDRLVFGQVADGRDRALELLAPIADQLTTAADLAEVLPDFLGANGPRTYLVGAANPSELRGVGGYLGSYTTLTIDDGSLEFGSFQPLNERSDLEPGDIPTDTLAARYEEFGGTWRWKNANMTPDMPSAARTLVLMWARQTGQALDGVLIVDPFALQTMLRVTGPVTTADGTVLDAEHAVAYLTNGAYADFDSEDLRKEQLGDAAKVVLQEFLGRGADLVDRLPDLASLVSDRQLLLYSTDPATQLAFADAGIDGALPDPVGDLVAVVGNSGTNAKVDYWLERTLEYDVDLLSDGAAAGDLRITLRNGAPTRGQPKYVIGPSVPDLAPGENRLHVSTYCATTCRIEGGQGGLSGRSRIDEELGHPVASTWVQMASGAQARLRYAWQSTGAWTWEGPELVYRLLVRTQTAILAPHVVVRVTVPDGFTLSGGSSGITTQDGRAVLDTTRRGDIALEFRFRVDD